MAELFQPDKIVLFGSYAYGRPNADSDVDLLVIMPARNQIDMAVKIRCAVAAPFPMDLIVRTPKEVHWRLKEGESFLTEVTSQGKVLYEKDDGGVGGQGRGRLGRRRPDPSRPSSPFMMSPAFTVNRRRRNISKESRTNNLSNFMVVSMTG